LQRGGWENSRQGDGEKEIAQEGGYRLLPNTMFIELGKASLDTNIILQNFKLFFNTF
jgi:hypothetical protein